MDNNNPSHANLLNNNNNNNLISNDYYSNGSQPQTVIPTENSLDINYNNVNTFCNYPNDDDFPVPYMNTPAVSNNFVSYQQYTSTNENVPQISQSQQSCQDIDQNAPQPINSFNITINAPQTNLYDIFRFGFTITITPISPPIVPNLDMQNQLQQDTYLNHSSSSSSNIIIDTQNQFQQ
jgi:hypothetical protein